MILNTRTKTLTSNPTTGTKKHKLIIKYPKTDIHTLNKKHKIIDVSHYEHPPKINKQINIIPNHTYNTTNLHNKIILHHKNTIISIIKIHTHNKIH